MAPNPEDRLSGTEGLSATDELEFEPVETKPKPKRHWGRWVSFAVVVVVGAGGGWYYFGDRLLPMNQEKSVPLIRADITPVKIKPADPGGMEVPDRDKLVYDRLKGEGAGTNVERLLPPPETPIPIPEDQLQGSTPEPEIAQQPPPESMVPESTESMTAQSTETETTTATTEQSGDATPVPLEPVAAEQETQIPAIPEAPPPPPAPVEPVETTATTPTPTTEPTSLEPTALEPAQPAAESVAETVTQAAQTIQTAQTEQTAATTASQGITLQSQEVASAQTAQTKEYRIQLAALRTHERAETEWKRQKKAHPDILGSLKSFIVRVDLGEDKGVFFRLRAGPLKDSKAAKALCGELAKRNVGCLVIRPGK